MINVSKASLAVNSENIFLIEIQVLHKLQVPDAETGEKAHVTKQAKSD